MFVYLITNKINNKQYVGQHSGDDIIKYWKKSISYAKCKRRSTRPIIKAIRKYGSDAFEIKPLVIVGNKWELDLYETGMIKALNTKVPNGYNLTDGGEGILNPCDLTRKRMSDAQKGNQYCLGRIESEETRRKKSLINMGNKNALGAFRSEEYRKKMSEAQKGRIFSDETKRKMSEAALGKIVTEETRQRMSRARKGDPFIAELLRKHQAEASRKGVHVHYHINRGIVNLECPYCTEVQCQPQTSSL